MTASDPVRLDPVGRLRLPRRSTTVRAALVAALLVTAAGVLYAGPGEPAPAGACPAPAAGTPTPGAARSTPPGPRRSGTAPSRPHAGTATPGTATPGPGTAGRATTGPAGPAAGGRLPIPDGLVGVPVPLADPARLAMVRPGDVVDLLTVPDAGDGPRRLAGGAPVLAVDRAGAALLLALTPDQGRAVVATAATSALAVIVRR